MSNELRSHYVDSIKNEYYNSDRSNRIIDVKSKIGFNLPKPYHLLPYVKKYPKIITIIFKLLFTFWVVLNPVFSLYKVCYTLIVSLFTRRIKVPEVNRLLLYYSNKFLSISNNIDDLKEDRVWFIKTRNNKKLNGKVISIYELCDLKTIFLAFRYSLSSYSDLKKQSKEKHHLLFSYTSFDWYLTWFVLEKINVKEFWFVNHVDRWAVLFDRFPMGKKIMAQHGVQTFEYMAPTKLNNIFTFYSFNQNQVEVFRSTVISNKNCIFKFFNASLSLIEIEKKHSFSLLLISAFHVTFDKEKQLLTKIKDLNLDVFLKTHPVFSPAPYIDLKNQFDFSLIVDRSSFPRTDIVISYNSTLAYEYEMSGCKVYYYDEHSIEELVEIIGNTINRGDKYQIS